MLRTHLSSLIPNPLDMVDVHFYTHERVKESVQFSDEKGKTINKKGSRSVVKFSQIPDDELEHRGVPASLFDIDVIERSGVDMKRITSPMFEPSLDGMSEFVDSVETQLTEADFEESVE